MVSKFIDALRNLSEKQALLLLIGITLALRIYAVLMAQGIANDSAVYGFIARDFLKGHFIKGLSSPAPPFYPFLIFLFSPGSAHIEIVGRLISLFFGTLAIIPLFYLAKEAIDEKGAIFSILFYSFHPYLATYSGMFLTETTYMGLLVLSAYFFWTGLKEEKIWKMSSSGILLGLAYLTRPEGIGYALIYLAWVVVDGVLRKKWFKKLVLIGVLIPSIFVFVVPYVMYIHQETGQWLISKKALTAQSRFLKEDTEHVDFSKGIENIGSVEKESRILGITKNVLRLVPFVTYHYLRAYHFSLWLFLFFGLIRVRRKLITYELFLASLVVFHLLSLATFTSSSPRFSVPIISLSLVWAGIGVLEIERILGKVKISNPEKVAFLLILFVILAQLPQSLKPERRHRGEQKKVGVWLKQNTPADAVIMSNSPQEAFYADRDFIILPPEISPQGIPDRPYQEILKEARTRGVRYILVDKNTHETNPGLVESISSSGLKEIFRKQDQALTIYEVKE